MIDLHTHILPGVDDGSPDIESSKNIIRLQNKQKVDGIALTPHFYSNRQPFEEFIGKRNESFESFREQVGGECRFVLGSETYISSNLLYIDDIKALCLGESDYLLLELPFYGEFKDKLFDIIEKLINNKNVIPIIAHIERYDAVLNDVSLIDRFRKSGCVIQLNCESFFDKTMRKFCLELVGEGKADIIASDCHNASSRCPNIYDAYKVINKKLGRKTVDTLISNSRDIFSGRNIVHFDEEDMILF